MLTSDSSSKQRIESLWKLGGLTPRQLVRDVVAEISNHNAIGKASELAFDFLFALFPLLLFLLTLAGRLASHNSDFQSRLLSYFADFLPAAAFQLLKFTAGELAAKASSGKLTFGIVVALWFASGGVSSMISALNLAHRVRETRSWIGVRAIAVGLTLMIAALMFSALFLVLATGHVVEWLGTQLGMGALSVTLWEAFQWPIAIAFVVFSCALIYFLGPNLKNSHWNWISPGSAFGALLWLVASIGFRVYLHFFNTYGATYGSLGAVMILLAWLYVTGLAFLIGGEINAAIERAAMAKVTTNAI